jgi:hypothetical protein
MSHDPRRQWFGRIYQQRTAYPVLLMLRRFNRLVVDTIDADLGSAHHILAMHGQYAWRS